MSVKMRFFWIYPAIVLASWLAVRTLAASPELAPDDPPAPLTTMRPRPEVQDVSLAKLIGHFASLARADRPVANP